MRTEHTIDGVDTNILRANARKTAITRKAPSAPVRLLKEHGQLRGRILDYGCGKGTDADAIGADKYDPAYFPTQPRKKYDTIICIYVLNVLPPGDMDEIVADVRRHLKKDGCAYFAVRRDVKKPGMTSKGTYQWNAVMYPRHKAEVIDSSAKKFIIYRIKRT